MPATATATRSFLDTHSVHPAKSRLLDDLHVSALAVGTYLGATDDATDRMLEGTLVSAVENGINFFDAAINYRCQRAERCIAYALKKLAGLGVPRDAIVITTKGGFLAGDGSMQGFKEYVQKNLLATGIIKPDDIVAGVHCMTPRYLQSQIQLSLNNLKIDCIDLYYLHNPETQIPHIGEFEFYKRLTLAFAELENQVTEGRIARYGIATWDGLRQVDGAKNHIDLEHVLDCAKAAAGSASHHFRAVQLPYNLAMLEAVAIKGQRIRDEEVPLIPAAVHHGLSVLISAPLLQGHVLQMSSTLHGSFPQVSPEVPNPSAAQLALQFVTSSPGVIAAMVGIKQPEHLAENLAILKFPNWEVADLQQIAQKLVQS